MSEIIFTKKYEDNSWAGKESRSGPGSSLAANTKLLSLLEEFVKENGIKTILDMGCGDFNWMKHFNFDAVDSYLGIDIVMKMIDKNNELYSSPKIVFKHCDLTDYYIGKYDLIICKDVLVHLSYQDALNIISKIKKSMSRYFLSTTFYACDNSDIPTGNWRPINLEGDPFNMGKPLFFGANIEDREDIWSNKSIGIWELEWLKKGI